MCNALGTKEGQRYIPDFLKDTSGTSVSFPKREQKNAIDQPLRADDVNEFEIERRRERLREQYSDRPGSVRPNPGLSRKNVMEEIT